MSNPNCALGPGAVALAPTLPIKAAAAVRVALARIAVDLAAWATARAERHRTRETVSRLMALSNRELKDMGFSRSEILSVVYGPPSARRVKYHAEV